MGAGGPKYIHLIVADEQVMRAGIFENIIWGSGMVSDICAKVKRGKQREVKRKYLDNGTFPS